MLQIMPLPKRVKERIDHVRMASKGKIEVAGFDKELFDCEEKIMKMHSDTASTYIQLSVGALALTVTFVEKLFPSSSAPDLRHPLVVVSCIFFLIATGFGSIYQYLAAKYLDVLSVSPGWAPKSKLTARLVNEPGIVYGFMLGFFYLGVLCFLALALKKFGRL
jgi:hypothetical protein